MTQSTKNSCSFGKAVLKLWESRKGWHWSQRSAARPEKVLQKVVHPSGTVRLSPHQMSTGRDTETAKLMGTPRSMQVQQQRGKSASSIKQNSVCRHSWHPPKPLDKYLKLCESLETET